VSNPKFIITRFTHGSAGKFLSTVLQTSDKIDHWSVVVQSQKNTELITPVTLEYVNRSFPKDHSRYLQAEPMVPYNTDLYSVGYPRGDNITLDQYVDYALEKNDIRLFTSIDNNRLANLVFHRPTLPKFCVASKAVTITVTTDKEKQWLFNTLWSKHFLEIKNKIYYIPSDPQYCNFQSLPTVLRFNNQYCFPLEQKDELYQKYVIGDHTNSYYFEPEKFTEFDSTNGIDNVFIKLSDILNADQFLLAISKIFLQLGLETPNSILISQMHKIWLSRQISYDL
jgi:uncharacterized protein YozE (UPF0346 family)